MLLRKFLRSRRLRKLIVNDHEVIRLALKNLDKPTDLKEAFTLSIAFDLDTIYQHAELARFSEKSDTIVAMDIRLATLRSFCALDASFAFQCLVAMPELLNDQRAIRSLHTYFNRLGLHEFAENLLGEPNFEVRKRRIDLTSRLFSKGKNKRKLIVKPSIFTDENLIQDLQKVDTPDIRDRLIRYLAQHELHEYIQELHNVLISNNIDLRKRREILFVGGEILIDQSLDEALSFYDSIKMHVSDARLIRRLAQHLERRIRYQEAIDILEPVSDQTSQRLRNAIKERHHWGLHGYDVDFLEKQTDYKPIEGRILYHIHASINHTTSGYSTRTHHICKSLIENGIDLHVRTRWGYPCDRSEVLLKPNEITTEILDGVTYLHDPEEEAFGTYAMEDYAQRAAYSLLNTALEIRPAVLHAASNHSVGFPAAMVAKALGIPFVYEMRGLWALSRAAKDEEYRRGDRFELDLALERHVAMAADHVIVITDGLRAQLEDWGIPAGKISLAPNGVDVSRFEMQNKDSNILQKHMLNGKTVIGYVGSLLKYEGLDYLFTAVSRLSDDLKSRIVVLIVGDGAYRKTLEKQVKNLGIDHIVQFIGKVPMEEVNSYYSVIDIAPFPRISAEVCEMISPLKPLEAMAMGSVVVASNVRAISEHVIPNVNGILFEKENAEDLCKKLANLLSDPRKLESIALESRKWVEEKRDWDLITDIIAGVYDHCENGSSTKEWQLDVLPAILQNGVLCGAPLLPNQVRLSGPRAVENMSSPLFDFSKNNHWQLSVGDINLTPKLESKTVEMEHTVWTNQLPTIDNISFSNSSKSIPSQLVEYRNEEQFLTKPTLLVCDETTSIQQIETALIYNSVLFSPKSEYLQGYVGIISHYKNLETIFNHIRNQRQKHLCQRKENWRRLILRTHPLLRLFDATYDRSYLANLDPLRYDLQVNKNAIECESTFLSSVLCQRLRPYRVIIDDEINQTKAWPLVMNALIVNGIEVINNDTDANSPNRKLHYDSEFDEHTGLDFCLNSLLESGMLHNQYEGNVSTIQKINSRILVVGHDLKFIRNIAKTWEEWGVEVTLLKSKNHACDLNISQQELMNLIASHDVIFCEWALGNTAKLAELRGKRPMFIRYHLQERKTEHILDANLIEGDLIGFVSQHTREDETRLGDHIKTTVVGNAVDTIALNVERRNPFSIGLMGITPQRKRLDFALSIFDDLENYGFNPKLLIKGKMPKDFAWMKSRTKENQWYKALQEKYNDAISNQKIVQEGYTEDIGSFFCSISAILSTSDFESFHLAPAEGAAARNVVAMLNWEGATDIHKREWIANSTTELATFLRDIQAKGIEYEIGENNRNFVMKKYDLRKVSLDLLKKILSIQKSTRDTNHPLRLTSTLFDNLFPRIVPKPKRMRIRTFIHAENSLPHEADSKLREIKSEKRKIVILASHMDLNLIDGSSIWYASMARMLSMANQHVVCVLTNSSLSSPILQPIIGEENITFITPEDMDKTKYGRKINYEDYVSTVTDIHGWYNREAPVFCRGFELAKDLVSNDINNIWCYLTDYYSHNDKGKAIVREETGNLISQIGTNGGKILCQTPRIMNELYELSKVELDSFILLPPIIPDKIDKLSLSEAEVENQDLSIVYAGKIAPLWGVESLIDICAGRCRLTIIGDKIHKGPVADSNYKLRMKQKLESNELLWIPRLSREEVLRSISQASLAWCARDFFFEQETRELSTKVLECLQAGTPPVITRSRTHEDLLGKDWPFFVDGPEDKSWLININEKLAYASNLMESVSEKLSSHKISKISRDYEKLLSFIQSIEDKD